MNNALYRLVYLSRNDISTQGKSLHDEIPQILRTARENNPKKGITGALMFNAEYFAQVLEGPRDKVEELFDRIQCDDRHSDMSMLSFNHVELRGFSEWAMAYVGEESILSDQFFMIGEETNFRLDNLTGDQIFDVLLKRLNESEARPRTSNAA